MKRGRGTVPVAPLARAFEISGRSAGDVARELGWFRYRGTHGFTADGSRVRRALGLQTYPLGAGLSRYREHVDFDTALKLAAVLHVAPVEVGA